MWNAKLTLWKFGTIASCILALVVLSRFSRFDKAVRRQTDVNARSSPQRTGDPRLRDINKMVLSDAIKCPEKYLETGLVKKYSRSQSGEDKTIMDKYFWGLCNGSYIELGALDGMKYSNTHLFEFAFGWQGTLIEPSPRNFVQLRENRPKNILHNAAVCESSQEVHYIEKGTVGGIYEFMAPTFRSKHHKNLSPSNLESRSTMVSCQRLTDILIGNLQPTKVHFDFLSLDIEGAEFEVLKTIDFEKLQFGVIFYEADEHNPLKNQMMRTHLEISGYSFVEYAQRSNWHINNQFHEIYSNLS